jgi:hypothetical protein
MSLIDEVSKICGRQEVERINSLMDQHEKINHAAAMDISEQLSRIITADAIAKAYPKEFALCYPRRYAVPGGYGSPKKAAACLATHLGLAQETELDKSASAIFFIADGLVQHNVPTYWASRDIVEASAATDLPAELCFSELKLPLPAILFMLPENAIKAPGTEGLSWIGFSEFPEGAVGFGSGNSTTAYSMVLRRDEPLSQNEDKVAFYQSPVDGSDWSSFLTTEDTGVHRLLTKIGVNLLMIMSSRPELSEVGTPVESPLTPDGRRPDNKLWSPNWIGRTYRHASRAEPDGTHASPRMHWRRGHWRHQPCGPNRSERKDIWIEPCLVSAPEEGSETKNQSHLNE